VVPSALISSLERAANNAIRPVLSSGAPGIVAVPTAEVGFIAAVVLGGVPAVAAAWGAILNSVGLRLSLVGVFCHQSPMVRFRSGGTNHQCELADLPIVVDDITGASIVDRRAVLVQAKMTTAPGLVTIAGTSTVQLDLYSNWHAFTLPTGFSPKPRDFHVCPLPGSSFENGRYGAIPRTVL
jgi:hypothetical protein